MWTVHDRKACMLTRTGGRLDFSHTRGARSPSLLRGQENVGVVLWGRHWREKNGRIAATFSLYCLLHNATPAMSCLATVKV